MTELGSAVVGFGWVLTALSGVIVTARSVMKILRFHGLAWEDYLMILSMVNSTSDFDLNNRRSFR